ncbi:MAG: heme-degrading domain-containing protein [Lachnospiraceae bacterium]|nr:heme-degrading domain-containing protein [Lachnospiraceae bacterium]
MSKEKATEEILNLLEMQEEILQFTHFTNEDAWELGKFLIEEARRKGVSVALSIRRMNGMTVFEHLMEGTTMDNAAWLTRKFNTVCRTEMSSLRFLMQLRQSGRTMQEKFLDESEYACCGGGFPIRVEEAGVVGVIICSNLNHVEDHDFLVRGLSKYLHMDEVPRISSL